MPRHELIKNNTCNVSMFKLLSDQKFAPISNYYSPQLLQKITVISSNLLQKLAMLLFLLFNTRVRRGTSARRYLNMSAVPAQHFALLLDAPILSQIPKN